MSKDYKVVKDTSLPLTQIRDRNKSSIISSVLDIERHAISRENWLNSLHCLYLAEDNEEPTEKRRRVSNGSIAVGSSELLKRRYLDPVRDECGRDYIAVSYTWNPSKEEEEEEEESKKEIPRRFFVESRRTGKPALPSEVRDVVWRRVLNYADHVGCENIWIDRECIDQDDEAEKGAMIQSMHLVYSLCRHPIALLTRTINTAEELDLLINLMCDEVRAEDEPAVLNLLNDITSNLWWTRAWTFQEDYKASGRMTLLIPHNRSLEQRKLEAIDHMEQPLLPIIEGEICISSRDFKERATEFCLSYKKRSEGKDICDRILNTAAQYNVLLKDERMQPGLCPVSRSMSPTILSDILSRNLSEESDRLAIVANCCAYTTRLDTRSLDIEGASLSLSILALYVLNGEILENHPKQNNRGTLNDNILEFLSKQSLDSFRPPTDMALTFIKSCRFIDPEITAGGTLTKGHLWRLGKVIRRSPMKNEKYNTLPPLVQFATDLQYGKYGGRYADLALCLCQWLHDPVHYGKRRVRSWGWQESMAEEVEIALMEGKALRLGCLVQPKYGSEDSPYRAVFVGDSNDDWKDETAGSYAFTSVMPANSKTSEDIQRHVSLEVEVEWQKQEGSERRSSPAIPKLYIKRWLNGLCFFENSPRRTVLFPWPSALLE
ncbi:hypothetical protein F4776DRAFT_245530 [Hypoxylon sp. NC0597]|nr:hypothetical protein F4776DRAFT_245530 [Hypoxylon sp. NC0597]